MDQKIKGTALITGGARRIGRTLALALAEDGYRIALHYNQSENDAKEVLRQIQEISDGTLFQCDLGDPAAVEQLVPRVFKTFPDCNLLINNASIFKRIAFAETDMEQLQRNFQVHVFAPFILSREFARQCKQGQIVNMLDTKVTDLPEMYVAYALSKKTLHELTGMSAKILGPEIRVNGIAPGLILPAAGDSQSNFERMSDKIPLKRTGHPDKIIEAVRFLLSNDFITGQTLFIDGGEHLI